MYNLLLSLALGLVSGLLSGILVGQAIAGVIPGVLLAVIAYIVLARRTGQQLQAIVNEAMAEFQGMENIAPPRTPAEAQRLRNLQLSKIAAGKEILRRGFALGPWQFLVSKQIHAQIGAIDYMQMDWGEARTSLEQAWSRNWQAKAMLACLDHREKKHTDALAKLEGAKFLAKKDPLFWGLYAWLAAKGGKRDEAVRVANEGLTHCAGSEALTQLASALANKKPLRIEGFAPGWYQFFPEHSPQYLQAEKQQKKHGKAPNVRRGGYSFPHPRR